MGSRPAAAEVVPHFLRHAELPTPCRGKDRIFTGPNPAPSTAQSLCTGCHLRAACLDYAMARPDLEGVWGGLTKSERTGLRRGARKTTRRKPPKATRRKTKTGPTPAATRTAARRRAVQAGWENGLTDREIAAQIGMTTSGAGAIRRALGLPSVRIRHQSTRDQAVRAAWGQGLTDRGIAERTGMTPKGARSARERLGLPRHPARNRKGTR